MGVIHKLRPEVINFILENKRDNPALSCRNLTAQIFEKLQVKVSKSSINAIFKAHSLSMPIGRRQKLKKRKFNLPPLPIIEETKAIVLTVEPNNPPPKQPPSETNSSVQEARLKEAEAWALKLQEEERQRLEQERLARIEAQKATLAENEKRAAEILQRQQTEKLLAEKQQAAEEERLRIEAEKKAQAEALQKAAQEAQQQAENELRLQETKRVKLLQEERLRLETERLKLEQEKIIAAQAAKDLKTQQQAEEKTQIDFDAKQKELAEKFSTQKAAQELNLPPKIQFSSGAIFLKALDCLVGAGRQINEIIAKKMGRAPQETLSLTEAIIFRPLFTKDNLNLLWALVGKEYSQETLDNYYLQIGQINEISVDIIKIISNAFIEARGLKVNFADGKILYLDSQLHSTWSTPYIPYDFSSTIAEIENGLQQCCFESYPNVLFCAPGYNEPTEDFLDLLFHTGISTIGPENVSLYNNELKEISNLVLPRANNYCLLIGLWPWQFANYRKVKKIGEFILTPIPEIERELYLAEIEIEFFQKSQNRSITLKGCAVKNTLQEKICVVILYSERDALTSAQIAGFYFSRWPNLEEAFRDFSKKIELFTYLGDSQPPLNTQGAMIQKLESSRDLKDITLNYLKMLDNYLRRYFLPTGYFQKDTAFTNENFYKLPVQFTETPEKITAKIQIPQGYAYLKDLEYLLYRLSERRLNLNNGKLLWFKNIIK